VGLARGTAGVAEVVSARCARCRCWGENIGSSCPRLPDVSTSWCTSRLSTTGRGGFTRSSAYRSSRVRRRRAGADLHPPAVNWWVSMGIRRTWIGSSGPASTSHTCSAGRQRTSGKAPLDGRFARVDARYRAALMWQWWRWPTKRRGWPRGIGFWRRIADLIAEAGIEGVTPRQVLAACAGAGLVVTLAFLVVSRTWPIALAFGAFAAHAPIALLRHRVSSAAQRVARPMAGRRRQPRVGRPGPAGRYPRR
jgi:hypothetical protein